MLSFTSHGRAGQEKKKNAENAAQLYHRRNAEPTQCVRFTEPALAVVRNEYNEQRIRKIRRVRAHVFSEDFGGGRSYERVRGVGVTSYCRLSMMERLPPERKPVAVRPRTGSPM